MITAEEARGQWIKIRTERVERVLKEAIEEGSRYCIVSSPIPESCIKTLIDKGYNVEQFSSGSINISW